jgi:hypothetical protein
MTPAGQEYESTLKPLAPSAYWHSGAPLAQFPAIMRKKIAARIAQTIVALPEKGSQHRLASA